MGPMAGLDKAFKTKNTAWLVVACDYPLLSAQHFEKLLHQRDTSKVATVYFDEVSNFLIPTLAIYEPSFLPLLNITIEKQEYSLQKILLANNIVKVPTSDSQLKSIDTPSDAAQIKKIIHEQSINKS